MSYDYEGKIIFFQPKKEIPNPLVIFRKSSKKVMQGFRVVLSNLIEWNFIVWWALIYSKFFQNILFKPIFFIKLSQTRCSINLMLIYMLSYSRCSLYTPYEGRWDNNSSLYTILYDKYIFVTLMNWFFR